MICHDFSVNLGPKKTQWIIIMTHDRWSKVAAVDLENFRIGLGPFNYSLHRQRGDVFGQIPGDLRCKIPTQFQQPVRFLLVSDSGNYPDCLKKLGVETKTHCRDCTQTHGMDSHGFTKTCGDPLFHAYHVQTAVVLFRFGRAWTWTWCCWTVCWAGTGVGLWAWTAAS